MSCVASLSTLPSASATPGSCRTSARSDSSNVGAVTPLSSVRSNADLPVMTAFEPWRMSVKIWSNAWSIESVRTKVPLIIATPRTIASAVRAVRSFRLRRPRIGERSHSYAMASSGFELRGAPRGHDRGEDPDDDRDDREHGELDPRDREANVVLGERPVDEGREEDPEREPDRRADERRDDALLPDHPADLPARHPDRAEHPDLTRALVDRQNERVDHPEDADEHRQREHDVEEREELVEVRVLALDPLLARLELRVGEAGDRLLELCAVRVVRLAGDVRPRPAVARAVVERVEQLRRDVDALEQRVEGRRLEGAGDT